MQTNKNTFLQLRPDSADVVLKRINLDKPGDMEQAVNSLKQWVKMQPHFKKTDFHDRYLESFIISSKGSVEKAKKLLDKMCTMRTLLPQFFEACDVRNSYQNLFNKLTVAISPKVTKDHYRVFLVKAYSTISEPSEYSNFFKYISILTDYIKMNDCIDGYLIVQDLSACDMLKFMANLNLIELRQAFTISMECYGMKIKGIHLISQSKTIEMLVGILKQLLKPKIANRISIHKTCEEIIDIVGKDVLPEEFGGTEKSIKELHEDWLNVISTKEYMEYYRDLISAGTDENLRPRDQFNEDYAGMPGTFRILSVD